MPKVKAAVLQRSRRSTAGKRMSSLVGKAQEDDDAFWSHSIWSETGGGFSDRGSRKRRREDGGDSSSSSDSDGSGDEGSASDGEGSYRMSDEDSAAAVDQFDSDFDESESEDDEEEEGGEERELLAEERRAKASKRKKNQRLGVPKRSSAGRDLMKKRTGKMSKRGPLGEGWNAGLVLNWPPPSGAAALVAGAKSAIGAAPIPLGGLMSGSAAVPIIPGAQASATLPTAPQTQPQHIPSKPAPVIAKPAGKSALRTGTGTGTTSSPPTKGRLKQTKQTAQPAKKKPQQPKFTQEDMILESIQSTETDNAKWLSARKRSKEEAAQLEKAVAAGRAKSSLNQKPVSRFYSRRGRHNTLTFMDMDQLPEILTRKGARPRGGSVGGSHSSVLSPRRKRSASETSAPSTPEKEKTQEKCVITGKPARYRDPKTKLGYHDLDAYKELKRRVESGEIKLPKPKPKPKAKAKPKPAPKKEKKMNGSSKGVSADATTGKGAINPGQTKTETHFPFTADKPTLVADANLKVMVTQGGCPVSPPVRIHLKLSAKSDKKGAPSVPLAGGSADTTNGGKLGAKEKNPAQTSVPDDTGRASNDSSTTDTTAKGEAKVSGDLQQSRNSASAPKSPEEKKALKPEASQKGNGGDDDRVVGAKGTFGALTGVPTEGDVEKKVGAEKEAKAPSKGVSTRTSGNGKTDREIPTPKNKRTTIEAN